MRRCTTPSVALAGRRERHLLELPSVARMAGVLAERCREPSWVRTLVASLDRFGQLTGQQDLEALLAAARADPAVADRALAALARALDGQPDAAVAGLAMGPRSGSGSNGVPVAWRPLPAATAARRLPEAGLAGAGRAAAGPGPDRQRAAPGRAAAGAGRRRRLARRRGRLRPRADAEPLAVRYRQLRGRPAERITFLSFAGQGRGPRRTWSGAAWPGSTPVRRRRWWPGPTAGRPGGPRWPGPARRANAIIRAGQQRQRRPVPQRPASSSASGGSPGPAFTPVTRAWRRHPPPKEASRHEGGTAPRVRRAPGRSTRSPSRRSAAPSTCIVRIGGGRAVPHRPAHHTKGSGSP